MSDSYPWAQALRINPEQISEWERELPSGQSLLLWCLESGKIDEAIYLQWASETFAMPVINKEFFAHLPTPPEQLLKLLSNNQIWTRHCFPIHSWDGVLFIGCDQKGPELSFEMPTQMVLAPPSELHKLWQAVHAQAVTAPPVTVAAPVAIAKPIATATPVTVARPAPSPALDSMSRPKGATLSLEDMLGSVAVPEATTEPAEKTPASIPLEPAAPEGLRAAAPEVAQMTGPLGLKLPFPNLKTAPKITGPPTTPTKPKVTAAPAISIAEPATLIAEPIAKPAPVAAIRMTPELATASAPISPLTNEVTENHEVTAVHYQSGGEEILAKINPPFEKAIVLGFADAKLKPMLWTAGWTPMSGAPDTEILLEQPSIFKIVHDSVLPYHGYVAGCDINDAFFQQWNNGEQPKHITMVPITLNRKLIGMILATANEDPMPLSTLEKLERVSLDFSNSIIRDQVAA
jgi:hypothetical protein